jgi:Carbohydrate binding domain
MKQRIGLALALAIGSSLTASIARAATEPADMVRGGGFEDGDKAGIGRGWASVSYGTGSFRFTLEEEKAQAGKYCQHIHVDEFKSGGAQLRQLGFALVKGQKYTITLWMRGNLDVPVSVGFRKNGPPYTYYLRESVRVGTAWQQYTITGTASEEDANAGLYIYFPGNGDLWLDSISAKHAAEETASKPLP